MARDAVEFEVIEEQKSLDAIDEALEAQLIRTTPSTETYEFTHALIRHTLYVEMNPSRQARLHRRLAEALGAKAMESAAEIAYQYHRSAAIPGADKGVAFALAAADRAEAGYAWDQVVPHLRVAADLIADDDPRYPRLLSRLGLSLPLVSSPDESLPTVLKAAEALASAEGEEAAADYLAEACEIFLAAGSFAEAGEAGAAGIRFVGARRDRTWVTLMSGNLQHRDWTAPDYPGLGIELHGGFARRTLTKPF